MKTLLYFGCIDVAGHYLWLDEQTRCHNRSTLERLGGVSNVTDNFIRSIDGVFTPLISAQGVYKECFVPPFRIVAWNDYTIDSRPNSNSALLGVGFASIDEMMDAARLEFPSVMNRQTSKLVSEIDAKC